MYHDLQCDVTCSGRDVTINPWAIFLHHSILSTVYLKDNLVCCTTIPCIGHKCACALTNSERRHFEIRQIHGDKMCSLMIQSRRMYCWIIYGRTVYRLMKITKCI